MMTRRQAIKTTALATAAVSTAPAVLAQNPPLVTGQPLITTSQAGPFTLPALPYAFDALEPHIDARTMEIHHGRHHKAYVDNLNRAVYELPAARGKSVEDLLRDSKSLPETIRIAVLNNGGGHYNHSLFWQVMKKGGGGEPKGELSKAITESFLSFTAFQETFTRAGTGQFGSGWAWLVLREGKLAIEALSNQYSPISSGKQVLLGLDVWEHAYYLKYQNKRADYITAWWNVVNWDFVAERYAKLNR